jgi:hypothetical protein
MAVAAMGEVSLLLADRAAAAAFEVCKSGVVECLLGGPGRFGWSKQSGQQEFVRRFPSR